MDARPANIMSMLNEHPDGPQETYICLVASKLVEHEKWHAGLCRHGSLGRFPFGSYNWWSLAPSSFSL